MFFWQSFTSCHDKKIKYLCKVSVMIIVIIIQIVIMVIVMVGGHCLPWFLVFVLSPLCFNAILWRKVHIYEQLYIVGVGLGGLKHCVLCTPCTIAVQKPSVWQCYWLLVDVASIQCVYHQCKLSSVTRVLIARWGSALPWEPETLLLLLLQPSSSSS